MQQSTTRRVLVLVGSPRRDGNSAAMASAVARGATAAGSTVAVHHLDDHIRHFLGDCRRCRLADGECSRDDGFRNLFLDAFLPADGVVFCSPVYWYGLSAQMKAFFDRSFCYYAASHPRSADVLAAMSGKRLGVALASEESYPGAALGIVHQFQEYARYTRSAYVATVRGTGNRRGEIASDPTEPLRAAEGMGRELFSLHYTDHRLDTPRDPRVWATC